MHMSTETTPMVTISKRSVPVPIRLQPRLDNRHSCSIKSLNERVTELENHQIELLYQDITMAQHAEFILKQQTENEILKQAVSVLTENVIQTRETIQRLEEHNHQLESRLARLEGVSQQILAEQASQREVVSQIQTQEVTQSVDTPNDLQDLLLTYQKNPKNALSELGGRLFDVLGGVPCFIDDILGSKLRLSQDCTRVTCTHHGPSGTFVAVNRPTEGRLMFILKTTRDFDELHTRIGFIRTDVCQSLRFTSFFSGLYLMKTRTVFVQSGMKEKLKTGALTRNGVVVVEFKPDSVTFSIPKKEFSHTITIPPGHLFGVHMLKKGESWSVAAC
ncbi:hypothetical protein RCL1_007347 [Eukaryota sp. TZLM3-RCL]